MTETRSAHPGFDFLHKAALILLAFQIAVAAKLTIEHGLDGPMDRFPIVIMSTVLLLTPLQRLAGYRHKNGGAGWLVASRAALLLILASMTLVFAFRDFLPPAGKGVMMQATVSLLWAAIALKGAAAGKLKPDGPLGICIYWTRHSRLAWDKAHRALGRILFWGGLAGLAASFVLPPLTSIALWGATIACAILAALYTSWRAWRRDPDRI